MEERLEIIDFANKSFGESGWSFSISHVSVDYLDENSSGHFSSGASAVVRVQRSNHGVFREEVGYGFCVGSHKGEVVSKAKKDAVTDGLKGAMISFGGEIAKRINAVAPVHIVVPGVSLHQHPVSANTKTSPLQEAVKPSPVPKTSLGNQMICAKQLTTPDIPCTSASKLSPIPNRVAPVPRNSSSMAAPLPQSSAGSRDKVLSEEELAKIERKKRQQQLQEEFRKKHLLEQAQQAQERHVLKSATPQSRPPLKEQLSNQPSKENNPGSNGSAVEVDDDVLLISTQEAREMAAVLDCAENNTNVSRRSPMLSSPSIVRPTVFDPRCSSRSATGHKRPDLSNYAFDSNPEKKARGT